MKTKALFATIIIGIILFWAVEDMPDFGDPDAPASRYTGAQYINNTYQDTGIKNIVTAILVSYRGFDTLGEVLVIFTAGLSVILLLRRGGRI